MARRHPAKALPVEDDVSELWSGQSRDLLKALHILTPEGRLNQDSRRKLKQVQHLVQLLKPTLDRLYEVEPDPLVVDLGAGKSYLGLILYDLVIGPAKRGTLAAVELRADLAKTAAEIARDSGFDRARFTAAPILSSEADAVAGGRRIALVTALHACDTATDDAIRFALKHDAAAIALVPCCQAEAARLLEDLHGPMDQLWRHPIQRRAFGAHLTNTIRALLLEAHGYKVRLTEFTGFEHTQKNELILAERVQRSNPQARAHLDRLLAQVPVQLGVLDQLT
jgi:hypothetical protein